MAITSPLEDFSPTGTFKSTSTGRTTLTVNRAAQGSLVNHRWVEGAKTQVVIEGVNIQPMKEREKLILPEPDRTKEWLKVYSPELLRTLREGAGGHGPDTFTFNGIDYEVKKVRNYSMGVLDHYKALAVSIEKTPD